MSIFEPGDFAPMRVARADAPFDDPQYRFEPKLDGIRALAYADARGRVRLESRSAREITAHYPDVRRAIAAALDGSAAVLDGEICALDETGVPDFAALLARESSRDEARAERLAVETPATFYAFDLLAVDGEPVLAEALEKRRGRLVDVAAELDSGFRVVEFLPGTGKRAFEGAIRAGLEGVVAKRVGSPYRPGARSGDWLKVKRKDAADLVVGAWLPGKGALAGSLGALALGAFDEERRLRYVGRVGTGFTMAERDALVATLKPLARATSPFADPVPGEARFVAPRLVVEVEFHEVTADGKLRAPALRGVRPDKRAEECRLADELAAAVSGARGVA